MTIIKAQMSNPNSTASSEKIDAPQILDGDARMREFEEGEARFREILACARDLEALNDECFRQIFARRDELPAEKLDALIQARRQLHEGPIVLAASLIRQQYEDAQRFLQLSQDFAREAAGENDPESKQRLQARSDTMASLATLRIEKADTLNRKFLAQITNLISLAPSHTESDTDKTDK